METPNKLVFIHCPFDPEYRDLFRALIFAIQYCGYVPHSALEDEDSGTARLDKIFRLIEFCDLSIHDISRTESNENGLPRFNMAFEWGLTIGFNRAAERTRAKLLVLDRELHRYDQSLSDFSGSDLKAHCNQPAKAIACVRDWLLTCQKAPVPGASYIIGKFNLFENDLPATCRRLKVDLDQLTFKDTVYLIEYWLDSNFPLA